MSAPNLVPPGTTGGGAPVGGSGTPDTLAKFATASSVGDSVVTESAGAVTITGSNALRGSRGGGGVASNFAAGDGALTDNIVGSYNTAIGKDALYYSNGYYNTATGANALTSNTIGNYNTATGVHTLAANISGSYATAVGSFALAVNAGGENNTAVGSYALTSNISGGYNTAIGTLALYGNTVSYNTAIGKSALQSTTAGGSNTAVGANALFYTTSGSNAAFGVNTLYENVGGAQNTAFGTSSLFENTSGNNNTALGHSTGRGITTGSGNTILGANVVGLAAGLTNNIILANGTGVIKAQHDGTDWSLTGNVGIGTASPTGRLHVVGGTAAAATNGAPVTIIAQDAGTGNQNGGNIVLTPGALSGSGSAGVADLSGPTGTGLKLPATPGNADAQTLDCYAEGTWTPTLAGFVTNTPGTITASYTRIGRMVTLNVYLYAEGSLFGSTFGTTTVTVPPGMTPNFYGVGHGGFSRTTSSVAHVIAYYDGKIHLGTSASAATEMFVSVTYFV